MFTIYYRIHKTIEYEDKQDDISITAFIKTEHNIQLKEHESIVRIWQRSLNDYFNRHKKDYDRYTFENSSLKPKSLRLQ